MKVLDEKVRDCLERMDGYENSNQRTGLIMYLKVGEMVKNALLSCTMSFLDRVYNLWYAHTYLRRWKEWWMDKRNPYTDIKRSNALPSQQLMNAIEINANGVALLIILMAEYFPQHPLLIDQINTSKLEHFFGRLKALMSGCLFTSTPGELLWKARKAVDKDVCEAELRDILRQDTTAAQEYPENVYPVTIPNLRDQINSTIDRAIADCSSAVEPILSYSNSQDSEHPMESGGVERAMEEEEEEEVEDRARSPFEIVNDEVVDNDRTNEDGSDEDGSNVSDDIL